MKTTKITDTEIRELKISSLPSRPTAPTAFGGKGFSAVDMKAAFDRLPLFIISKFNSLIEDISALPSGEDSLLRAIPSGLSEGHTLADMLLDISSGGFASYLSVGEDTLISKLLSLKEAIDEIKGYVDLPSEKAHITRAELDEVLAAYASTDYVNSEIARIEGELSGVADALFSLNEGGAI